MTDGSVQMMKWLKDLTRNEEEVVLVSVESYFRLAAVPNKVPPNLNPPESSQSATNRI